MRARHINERAVSTNPYAPPKSDVELEEKDLAESVPEDVLKKIKQAWVAGIISSAVTLVATLVAMSGVKVLSYGAWELIDVALLLGLTYGIYRNSRVCAVLMLVYFLAAKLIMLRNGGQSGGLVLGIVFLYYYARGVMGTFAYHKHMRQSPLRS
jgi:hypothetical protein